MTRTAPILPNDAVGISLKGEFYNILCEKPQPVDFLETHIENYFDGGYHLERLQEVAALYPLTLHGVGLSLGSHDIPSDPELTKRKNIIDIIHPAIFSEHAAWTRSGNSHLNDLLPFPMTKETVQRLVRNITATQDFLKQPILIENLSSYMTFEEDTLGEAEFMNEVCAQSGCSLLLDINNIYVQEYNLGRSAEAYLKTINAKYVKQYHLAGGEKSIHQDVIIDTHGTDIPDEVMALYKIALDQIGLRPTLYERDNNIPSFDDMLSEVKRIKNVQKEICAREYV